MAVQKFKAIIPQGKFLDMKKKFRAFVGGFGSSKTFTGAIATCLHFYQHPGINSGYFAPTYSHIRDIYYPTIQEASSLIGQRVEIREGNKEVHHYSGRKYRGTTICRSLDRPENIVGFKIGHAHVDEIDILNTKKASLSSKKITARMRYKKTELRNGIDYTTTPEGFKFTYDQFVKNKTESYGLIKASTYDNAIHLPDDYISSLYETYPPELRSAYLNGEFVNLTSGTVYYKYNRQKHRSNETVQENEPIYVGQDFNVEKMASSIFVRRPNGWHVVGQLKEILDTPALVSTLQEKFPGHKITIYPDASGGNRSTKNASVSDLSILRQSGFAVNVNSRNPFVKDRILSVNAAFEKGKLWVNDYLAPDVADSLEKQSYDKNGEPDKASGFDHMNDATGYLVAYELPVNKPVLATGIRMVR